MVYFLMQYKLRTIIVGCRLISVEYIYCSSVSLYNLEEVLFPADTSHWMNICLKPTTKAI